MNDLISRQAAIDVLHGYFDGMLETDTWSICDVYGLIKILPSAEPPYNLDEWCHDCKEYDQERHCCPRFNRVIKQTKEDFEAQNEIIYCKDCRHHGTAICRIWSRYGTINTPGYGFCFRGERRTDETD